MNVQDLVNAVKNHARKNWNKNGWDFIYECYDDSDIVELIGDAKTEKEAIKRAGRIAKVQDANRREIQATAW